MMAWDDEEEEDEEEQEDDFVHDDYNEIGVEDE